MLQATNMITAMITFAKAVEAWMDFSPVLYLAEGTSHYYVLPGLSKGPTQLPGEHTAELLFEISAQAKQTQMPSLPARYPFNTWVSHNNNNNM
jgi:hypothetical protein